MVIPAAMNIETAADLLPTLPINVRNKQFDELRSFGVARAQQMGATGISGFSEGL